MKDTFAIVERVKFEYMQCIVEFFPLLKTFAYSENV